RVGTVHMAAYLGSQLCHALQQFPSVVPRAAHVDVFPLWSQIPDALRRAGLEAITGQDHGASVNIHDTLRGLRSSSLDTLLSRGQQVQHQGVVDHADTLSFGGAEQSLRQARATIPELDHGACRKVDATVLGHGRLVQLKAY